MKEQKDYVDMANSVLDCLLKVGLIQAFQVRVYYDYIKGTDIKATQVLYQLDDKKEMYVRCTGPLDEYATFKEIEYEMLKWMKKTILESNLCVTKRF